MKRIWQKVFRALWQERVTKNHIADELHVPFDERENLVFGLACSAPMRREKTRTKLRLV